MARVAHAGILVFAVSVFGFLLVEIAPGDYFQQMEVDPRIPQETVDELRARYGVDRPFVQRYVAWLVSVSRGELGFSFAYGEPVGSLIRVRARNTLLITVSATVVSWALALVLGIIWALQRNRWGDALGGATSNALLSVPDLLWALALLFAAARTGAFPIGGMTSLDYVDRNAVGKLLDLSHHMVLPVAALSLGAVPGLTRHVRGALVDVMNEPFVLAARAQGMALWRIVILHALPVAANPLLSLFGLSIAGLLSASLVVEVVLGWPGLGPLVLEAIRQKDVHLVVTPVVASAMLLALGNLVADLLLFASDPRIRQAERAS
jgi:peptide/nickel transport system permease protein